MTRAFEVASLSKRYASTFAINDESCIARRAIGVVCQNSLLDDSLTVRENLTVHARP